jgi:hypothetical protein
VAAEIGSHIIKNLIRAAAAAEKRRTIEPYVFYSVEKQSV